MISSIFLCVIETLKQQRNLRRSKMEKEKCLKVQMLGDFIMTYQGKVLSLGKSQTTKVLQLLQLLLYAGPQGFTRLQLMERLYGSDVEGDRANNLRVTVFHLRRLLEKMNSISLRKTDVTTLPVRFRWKWMQCILKSF